MADRFGGQLRQFRLDRVHLVEQFTAAPGQQATSRGEPQTPSSALQQRELDVRLQQRQLFRDRRGSQSLLAGDRPHGADAVERLE